MTHVPSQYSLLGLIGNTPLVRARNLDVGVCELYLKLESQNPGGSIKDRIAVSMIEAAERGDFAAARRWHQALIPLMLTNFVESNPIPVKAAMAAMGLCEEVYRLPMVPPGDAARQQIVAVLIDLGLFVAAEVRA